MSYKKLMTWNGDIKMIIYTYIALLIWYFFTKDAALIFAGGVILKNAVDYWIDGLGVEINEN